MSSSLRIVNCKPFCCFSFFRCSVRQIADYPVAYNFFGMVPYPTFIIQYFPGSVVLINQVLRRFYRNRQRCFPFYVLLIPRDMPVLLLGIYFKGYGSVNQPNFYRIRSLVTVSMKLKYPFEQTTFLFHHQRPYFINPAYFTSLPGFFAFNSQYVLTDTEWLFLQPGITVSFYIMGLLPAL